MSALRPFLARLLALALVLGGGVGLAGRAPQALRGWVDVVAEVTPGQRGPASRSQAQPRPGRQGARPRAPAARPLPAVLAFPLVLLGRRVAPADAVSAALPPTHAAWPLARAGRDVIDLKRARLI